MQFQLPKREKFEGSAVVDIFFVGRNPNSNSKNCDLKDYEVLFMIISSRHEKPFGIELFTADKDFIQKARRFYGEIKIVYDSGWTMLMEASNLGLEMVSFYLPKKANGSQEVLVAYVDGRMLSKLCEYFLPNLAT